MALNPDQFMAQLPRQSGLKPAYLIAGAEHLLVLECAQALRQRARELGYSEREVFEVDARSDWNEFGYSASAMSLFSSQRVMDLRLPSGKPGKEGAAAISAFCANPPPDVLLLITCQDWSKRHEGGWTRDLDRIGDTVICWPVKAADLPGWIGRRLRQRELQAERDAVLLLAERVEGNLLAAAQEVDKLALAHGPGARLDIAAIEAHCADHARFDIFGLVDAMLSGDAVRLRRVMRVLRAENESAAALLGWINNQVLLLSRLATAQAAGNLTGGFSAERVFPARQALFKRALQRSPLGAWRQREAELAHIERMAKGQQAGDAWLELERLLLRVCLGARFH